jgi:hypothetical protein
LFDHLSIPKVTSSKYYNLKILLKQTIYNIERMVFGNNTPFGMNNFFFLDLAHAHLSPHFCPCFAHEQEDKGKNNASFFEHMLVVSTSSNLSKCR